jgi:hypothetical protein
MADYAISNVPRRVVYANSGVGPYAFTFEILSQTDISVYRGSTLLTLTTDYSVTINTNGTGSVTLVTAGTGNITIVGAKNIQRTTDFTTGGDLFANSLNDELDNQTIFVQQVAETAERGLKAPVVDPTDINMTLPSKTDRAGTFLAFDSPSGNPIAGPSIASVGTVTQNIANINTVATNIASVNTVATNITNVNTVAGISGNVTTVANNNANVTAVATDLAGADNIGTVSGDIANVNAVGSNIANVNTVAGIDADITTVAGIDSDITTVAGIASDVSAVADIDSDVTTVAGIDSDVTAVAADATDIGAVATNIANVNSVAGNSTNINAVASNSTNINTVAGISSNVTTVAGVSANVTTVAGISANVTTVAGISADVTTVATNVADINNYADTYQGAKASDPSLRNDGSALQSGDLYFNTTDDVMKVREAGAWLAAYASLAGALIAANNLSDLTNKTTARQNLDLEIGVDVQAYDAQLADVAGLSPADNNFIVGNGTNFVAESGSTARTSLGLGSIATQDSSSVTITGGSVSGITDLAVADGGTGASDASTARTNLGLAIGTDVQAYSAELQGATQGGIYGFKNRIINGAMVISQYNGTSSITPTDTSAAVFALDRWAVRNTQASKYSIQQSTTVPTGFRNSIAVTSLSAYSVGSSDFFNLLQKIEGFNVSDLGWGTANAQTITLSFWVQSSLTGTFGGVIHNNAFDRSYPFTYTINSANTFETKTVTIQGDTTGTWLTDNGAGLILNFSLGAGSTVSGTAGSWSSTGYRSATGATSVVGTNGATFYITGVQLEKGSTATSFDYRPYGTELSLCQRYFTNFTVSGGYTYTAQAHSSTAARTQAIPFKVSMRAAPTITLGTAGTSSGQSAFLQASNSNPSGVGSHAAVSITTEQFLINSSGYSGTNWSAGTATSFYVEGTQTVWASSAEL